MGANVRCERCADVRVHSGRDGECVQVRRVCTKRVRWGGREGRCEGGLRDGSAQRRIKRKIQAREIMKKKSNAAPEIFRVANAATDAA